MPGAAKPEVLYAFCTDVPVLLFAVCSLLSAQPLTLCLPLTLLSNSSQEKKGPVKKKKLAKKASKQKTQWGIMAEMGVPEHEIALFQDALHWLKYSALLEFTELC
jgi:hypothetical protein